MSVVMFQPPQTTTSPTRELERDEEPPQPMYYMHAPPPPPPEKSSFLDGVSKLTLVLIFIAFVFGLMLGKSMTPIVLGK